MNPDEIFDKVMIRYRTNQIHGNGAIREGMEETAKAIRKKLKQIWDNYDGLIVRWDEVEQELEKWCGDDE